MCNSVYYFADNEQVTPNNYPFPQLSSFLLLIGLSDFSLFSFHTLCFKIFIHFFFRVYFTLSFTSFSMEIWSLIRQMYFRRKNFYQKSGKNVFFWNTFMIVDWKISLTFRSCNTYYMLKVNCRNKNLTICERKISSCKPALRTTFLQNTSGRLLLMIYRETPLPVNFYFINNFIS